MCQEGEQQAMDDDLEITITAKLPDGRSESITVRQEVTWGFLRNQLAQRFQLELQTGMHLRGVVRGRLLLADDTMHRVMEQSGARDCSTIIIHCVIPFDDDGSRQATSTNNPEINATPAADSVRNGAVPINPSDGDTSLLMPFLLTAVGNAAGFQPEAGGAIGNHVISSINSILSGAGAASPIHEILLCGSTSANESDNNRVPGTSNSDVAPDQDEAQNQQSGTSRNDALLSAVLGNIAAVSSDTIAGAATVTEQPSVTEEQARSESGSTSTSHNVPSSSAGRRDRWNRRGRENLRMSSNAATRSMFQRTGVTSIFGSPGSRSMNDETWTRAETNEGRAGENVFRVRFIRGRPRRDRNRGSSDGWERRSRPMIIRNAGYASAQVGNAVRLLRSTNNLLNVFGEPNNTSSNNSREGQSPTDGQAEESNASAVNRAGNTQDYTGKFIELDLTWECLYKLQESGGLMISVIPVEQRALIRQTRLSAGSSPTRVYMQELYLLDQAANSVYQDILIAADARSGNDDFVVDKCLLFSALQGALSSAHAKASLLLSTGAQDLFTVEEAT